MQADRALRLALILSVLLSATTANAEVRAGGAAGATVTSGFPTYLLGGDLCAERWLVDHVALVADARLQAFLHPEDENYSRWGFQEDISAGLRLRVFSAEASQSLNPYVVGRAGLAGVQRIPFNGNNSSELLGGYIVRLGVGADLNPSNAISRVELSFDFPSFMTHADSRAFTGELSLALSTKLPW